MTEPETQTLGKYELVREIGRGSMGTVHLARDPFALRDVAIKVEQDTHDADDRASRRRRKLFFNEAKAAGLLRHPNIVATYDAGVDEGMRFIVMEYLPGAHTLERYCDPENLLPIEQVVEIMLKCALALGYAHEKGVVHRDVKPQNIMLTQDREVKIADFGVALITAPEIDETQVMGTLGSPRYMSPEQVMGEAATSESDIWCLGVVSYELLTGTNPFSARTMPEIARNITKNAHTPVRELRPEVPAELAHVVDRTLKKHPAGRYRNAHDLAGDLSLVHDGLRLAGRDLSHTAQMRNVRTLSFFEGFEDAEILEVASASSWEEYPAGTEIVVEGEAGDAFYVLVSGHVMVRRGRTEVDVLGPGASFGEIGFIAGGERTATIVAQEPVTVMKVNANLVERSSLDCQLRFQKAFLRTMAERLAKAMKFIGRTRPLK